MNQLSGVITTLARLQDIPLPADVNPDLVDTLKLAFDVFYSDEDIFELSQAREPRVGGTNTTVSQVYLFDWLCGA